MIFVTGPFRCYTACNILCLPTVYDNDAELAAILDSDSLRADLHSFLGQESALSSTEVLDESVTERASNSDVLPCGTWIYGTHCASTRSIPFRGVLL